MSLGTVLLICLCGAAGAVCRFFIDTAIKAHWPHHSWRTGTIVVNAIGSFLLGFLTALWIDGASASPHTAVNEHYGVAPAHYGISWQSQWLAIAGTGFCGGLTTFSTVSLDTVEIAAQHGGCRAMIYSGIVLAVSLISAVAGLICGTLCRYA